MEVAGPPVPPQPPPSVIFSIPLADETDVPIGGRIRIQFSRDMNESTFRERLHVRYSGPTPPSGAPPTFTVTYNDGNRSLEIRFKERLAPFQVLVIQLEVDRGLNRIEGRLSSRGTLRSADGS